MHPACRRKSDGQMKLRRALPPLAADALAAGGLSALERRAAAIGVLRVVLELAKPSAGPPAALFCTHVHVAQRHCAG